MTEERGPISIPQPETVSVEIPTAAMLGASSGPSTVTTQSGNVVATPTATEEDERVSAGQRNVNLIWENTQTKIALSVVFSVMAALALVVVIVMMILGTQWQHLSETKTAVLVAVLTGSLSSLTSMGSLVIGFYFGRTNHQRIGGVGPSDAGR